MRGLKHRERNKDSEEEDLEENLKANHQLSSIYINKMFSMVIFYYSSDLVMRGWKLPNPKIYGLCKLTERWKIKTFFFYCLWYDNNLYVILINHNSGLVLYNVWESQPFKREYKI